MGKQFSSEHKTMKEDAFRRAVSILSDPKYTSPTGSTPSASDGSAAPPAASGDDANSQSSSSSTPSQSPSQEAARADADLEDD
jgi:hypothetical protein